MRVAVLDDYQGNALRLADWNSLQPEVQVEAFPGHTAPHLGYAIEENLRINYRSAVENIRAFLDGKPIRLVKRPN